jgi:hypothetical protein
LLFDRVNTSMLVLPKKIEVEVVGKVFRWKVKKRYINFSVHYSHKTKLILNKFLYFFKKVNKTKNKFFFFNPNDFFFFKKFIKQIRYANLFTNRGVRTKPRFFLKKQGKISTYV